MNLQALPYILLLGILFGTTLIASRIGVQQIPPVTLSGLRLILASVVYIAIYLLPNTALRWPRGRRLWRRAAVLGLFDTAIPITFVILSLQYQSSGVTAILVAVGPALTVLMAHFFLPDESLTGKKALGITFSFGGALLIGLLGENGFADTSQASPAGLLLVLGAQLCISLMTIYSRKYMQEMDPFQVGTVRTLVGALIVMPLALLLENIHLDQVDLTGYLALAYAAIPGTFLTMYLVFYNIRRFGATAQATVMYVIPIVGSIGGMLLLNETITPGIVAGTGLIALGLTVINLKETNAGRHPGISIHRHSTRARKP